MLLLIHLMMLYCLQQIGCCSSNKAREELKAATSIEVTHLDICSFQERVASLLSDSSKITTSRFRSSKDVFSSFSIFDPKKVPPSLGLMSYLYMDTVQFKLLLDSLGEIYQLNHWEELDLKRQPLYILTSEQSWKCIVSSLLWSQKMIHIICTYN